MIIHGHHLRSMAPPGWTNIGAECKIATSNVVRLGEGWSCVVYLVDSQYVFKLAKKAEGGAELVKEAKLLEFLEARLPATTPTIHCVFPESKAWENGYSVQGFIDGTSLSKAPSNLDMMADRVGTTLRVLHSLPQEGLGELTNPSFRNEPHRFLAEALDRIQQRYGKATRQQIDLACNRFLDTRDFFEFVPCLIHGDLHDEHIIQINDRKIGLIDWGDAVFGDPDRDFLLLYQQMGQGFVSRCAQAYGHNNLPLLFQKLEGLVLLSELYNVVYAGKLGFPGEEDKAFEGVKRWADRNA